MTVDRAPDQQTASPEEAESRTANQATASPQAKAAPQPDIAAIIASLERFLGARYEVLQPVSVGGMATIVQLRHRLSGGFFVAKVLHEFLVDVPGVVAAFHREACHVARLAGHPAIVPVFDIVAIEGTFAMLLPYVEGEDLDRILLRQGKLSRDEALMLVAQLGSLLMYAEAQGIVHCDLAPGNVRLDHFGTYRLLDFGISRTSGVVPSEPMPSTGTPTYNSPEQIRNEPPDIRTDLYSLGLILAEVLTGEPLLKAPTLPELAALHLADARTLPPELEADPAVAKLIHSLIRQDKNQRMGSAFELSGAVAAMGFELPSFHPSLGSLRTNTVQLPRPRRRRLESAASA